MLSKTQIEEMATVDEFEVVKEVQVSFYPLSHFVSCCDYTKKSKALTDIGILCGLSSSIPFTLHLDSSGTSRWRGRTAKRESPLSCNPLAHIKQES